MTLDGCKVSQGGFAHSRSTPELRKTLVQALQCHANMQPSFGWRTSISSPPFGLDRGSLASMASEASGSATGHSSAAPAAPVSCMHGNGCKWHDVYNAGLLSSTCWTSYLHKVLGGLCKDLVRRNSNETYSIACHHYHSCMSPTGDLHLSHALRRCL